MRQALASLVLRACLLYAHESLPPVVMIPGLASSILEVRVRDNFTARHECSSWHEFGRNQHEWHRLWVNVGYMLPGWSDCFIHRMSLSFDTARGTLDDVDNIETRVPGWGDTTSIDYLDPILPEPFREAAKVWHPFNEHLLSLGYERGRNLRGAPYDWRYAPSSLRGQKYLSDLKELVEDSSKKQGGKVMLVSHSLGSNYALAFLRTMNQSWKNQFIAGWVSVGGVFGGSMQGVVGAAAGFNEGVFLIDDDAISIAERTWESLWWLFPQKSVFGNETVVASSPARNYTLSELRDLFTKRGFADGFDFFTERVKRVQDDLSPVGVPLHCFYSTGIPTVVEMQWDNDDLRGDARFVKSTAGDGSVSDESLQACRRMQPASVHSYTQIEHEAMIQTSEILKEISTIIVNMAQQSVSVLI